MKLTGRSFDRQFDRTFAVSFVLGPFTFVDRVVLGTLQRTLPLHDVALEVAVVRAAIRERLNLPAFFFLYFGFGLSRFNIDRRQLS